MKKLFYIVTLLALGVVISGCEYDTDTTKVYTVKVLDKERVAYGQSEHKYLIFTELEDGSLRTFENTDNSFVGKTNSSDIYGAIQPDKKYQFKTIGRRSEGLSTYENIIEFALINDEDTDGEAPKPTNEAQSEGSDPIIKGVTLSNIQNSNTIDIELNEESLKAFTETLSSKKNIEGVMSMPVEDFTLEFTFDTGATSKMSVWLSQEKPTIAYTEKKDSLFMLDDQATSFLKTVIQAHPQYKEMILH